MDEVREAFSAQEGSELADWIEGDCSGDYKDTLVRLSKRRCFAFPGSDQGLTIAPPKNQDQAVHLFNKCFNRCCAKKKENPDQAIVISEAEQQQMAVIFSYFGKQSEIAPNLDRQGVWDLTNACGPGFTPGDDGEDLDATFDEWDVSGSGDICWNDFVAEMTVRVN